MESLPEKARTLMERNILIARTSEEELPPDAQGNPVKGMFDSPQEQKRAYFWSVMMQLEVLRELGVFSQADVDELTAKLEA